MFENFSAKTKYELIKSLTSMDSCPVSMTLRQHFLSIDSNVIKISSEANFKNLLNSETLFFICSTCFSPLIQVEIYQPQKLYQILRILPEEFIKKFRKCKIYQSKCFIFVIFYKMCLMVEFR